MLRLQRKTLALALAEQINAVQSHDERPVPSFVQDYMRHPEKARFRKAAARFARRHSPRGAVPKRIPPPTGAKAHSSNGARPPEPWQPGRELPPAR